MKNNKTAEVSTANQTVGKSVKGLRQRNNSHKQILESSMTSLWDKLSRLEASILCIFTAWMNNQARATHKYLRSLSVNPILLPCFVAVLEIKPKALWILGKCSTNELYASSPKVYLSKVKRQKRKYIKEKVCKFKKYKKCSKAKDEKIKTLKRILKNLTVKTSGYNL